MEAFYEILKNKQSHAVALNRHNHKNEFLLIAIIKTRPIL